MRAWVYAYSTGALAREVTRIHQNMFDLVPFRGRPILYNMDGQSSINGKYLVQLSNTPQLTQSVHKADQA